MSRKGAPLGYYVALLDILGFEYKLNTLGIDAIHEKYKLIVEMVRQNTERNSILDALNFTGPMWTAKGGTFFTYNVHAAYASDSIILWANRAFKMVQNKSIEALERDRENPAYGHLTHPVPLLPFINFLTEVMCQCLEAGLPLRGAISNGDCIFDEEENVFLGQPICDVARLEKKHKWIGVTACPSLEETPDLINYFIQYNKHVKFQDSVLGNELVLNWPLYFLNSRKANPRALIIELNEANPGHHEYYDNTIAFIDYSLSEIK